MTLATSMPPIPDRHVVIEHKRQEEEIRKISAHTPFIQGGCRSSELHKAIMGWRKVYMMVFAVQCLYSRKCLKSARKNYFVNPLLQGSHNLTVMECIRILELTFNLCLCPKLPLKPLSVPLSVMVTI